MVPVFCPLFLSKRIIAVNILLAVDIEGFHTAKLRLDCMYLGKFLFWATAIMEQQAHLNSYINIIIPSAK